MRLAWTMTEGRGDLDLLLHDVAADLRDAGLQLAGIVQINVERPGTERCDMDAVVLPDGPTIRISQSLGGASRGCRLDPAGLESAVGATMARLEDGADLLIVNKFGKQEAQGRGFRPAIADALARGTDVLVGVNPLNLDALRDFAGELGAGVPPERAALVGWALSRRRGAA